MTNPAYANGQCPACGCALNDDGRCTCCNHGHVPDSMAEFAPFDNRIISDMADCLVERAEGRSREQIKDAIDAAGGEHAIWDSVVGPGIDLIEGLL